MIDKIFNHLINGYKALIENKYIKLLKGKLNLSPREFSILRHDKLKETHIQQSACRMVKSYAITLPKNYRLKFVQIDNGGNLSIAGKIRKKREGTYANFCDVMILGFNGKENKVWFVEFKRVGSRSEIVGDKEHFEAQLREIEDLNYMGFEAYITNNMLFFEHVVMESVKQFFYNQIKK